MVVPPLEFSRTSFFMVCSRGKKKKVYGQVVTARVLQSFKNVGL